MTISVAKESLLSSLLQVAAGDAPSGLQNLIDQQLATAFPLLLTRNGVLRIADLLCRKWSPSFTVEVDSEELARNGNHKKTLEFCPLERTKTLLAIARGEAISDEEMQQALNAPWVNSAVYGHSAKVQLDATGILVLATGLFHQIGDRAPLKAHVPANAPKQSIGKSHP